MIEPGDLGPLDTADEVADLVPDDVPYTVPWLTATLVGRRDESPSAATLELDAPGWRGAMAGQHVDVRLTADDGYSAQRSYSLASPASMGIPVPGAARDRLSLTVQVVHDGEVSPYLTEDFALGDQLEIRGPIGNWFVWHPTDPRPVQLVAGGSGLVPLMSMARTHALVASTAPMRLLVSVRTPTDALYADELDRLGPAIEVTRVWTREGPQGWTGPVGRIDAAQLETACVPPTVRPRVFVCGPTGFVESVADALVDLGHDAELSAPNGSGRPARDAAAPPVGVPRTDEGCLPHAVGTPRRRWPGGVSRCSADRRPHR